MNHSILSSIDFCFFKDQPDRPYPVPRRIFSVSRSAEESTAEGIERVIGPTGRAIQKAVAGRCHREYVNRTPGLTKTTVATNRYSTVRTEADSTTPSAESDNSSRLCEHSDQHSQREVQKNESKHVRQTDESGRECSAGQNMDLV